MDGISALQVLVPSGLAIGLVFGFAVQRSDWCAMGAISDIALIGDWRRMRSWLLAIATALLGTQALALSGAIEPGRSAYLGSEIRWLGAIAGGLAFGYGMTRTGGCISKNLVRLGGGSLRALVVLMVVALAALATRSDALAWLGQPLAEVGTLGPGSRFPQQGLTALLSLGPGAAAVFAVLIAGAIGWFCLKDDRFRANRPLLIAGLVLGLLVPLGWLATTAPTMPAGALPAAGLNFVDAAAATLSVLTGNAAPAFGVALLAGTVLGGSIGAGGRGRLRLEGFAGVDDLRRNLGGAVLMGVGGAVAGGCTVGQGLSGVSTLGLTSCLALGAIILGARAGIRTLETGGMRGALRALARG